jgi:HD domain
MEDKIQRFKAHVIDCANNPEFVHHPWFVRYHLEIVERIARELLDIYSEADRDLVIVLVWLHDYGKTLDFANQYERTLTAGRAKLLELGFDAAFTDKAIEHMELVDRKMEVDLTQAPLEVKIVSSADAASHHVGPFMALYWWEHADRPIEQLMQGNRAKTMKDWDRKMVLPEVREAFAQRHRMVLEQSGEFPDTFFS